MKRFLLWLLLVPLCSFGQKLQNIRAEVAGPTIIITYDLSGGQPGDKYNISLTSSANNYLTPLTRVTGDVGKGVLEGTGKKIIWQANTELGTYKGQITFEVQAEVVAALSFSPPISSAKRGTTRTIAWRGGDAKQEVKIELLQSGFVTDNLASLDNKGSYSWNISSKQKPGNYQLRLTNGRESVSQFITIKHKIPTLVKVLPFVIGGAAAVVLMGGGGGGGNDTPTKEDATLPSPPEIL